MTYWADSKSRGLTQLTTKLHKRIEHQAEYNCDKFQGRRLNESKDTEVKQRDL